MSKDRLFIVVPCYNEQQVLSTTDERLRNLLRIMVDENFVAPDSRILYVNDGSTDNTWSIIERLTTEHECVCGLKLAANVGHQCALLAGLEQAAKVADITVSIDADLQDDINVIPEMVAKWRNGADIVYGVRRRRDTDSWFKRNTALTFYRLMQHLGVRSVYNHADFRLMSRRAVEQLCRFRERNLFLRGMVPLVGYKSDTVTYDRSARMAGESKYPLGKMLNFAADGITSFSIKPVRLVLWLGVIFTFVALVILVYVLIAYFTGRTVSGWASLMLSIWFVGGFVLIGLGIVGEYIGKIYIEVKDRPRYNVEQAIIK